MIPIWAISAIGSALIAGAAGYGLASKLGDAELARKETAWYQVQVDALAAQAKEHNLKVKALEGLGDDSKRMLDQARVDRSAAEAANERAAVSDRRMRDKLATSDLAIGAALEAAGLAKQCEAATKALAVRARLLEGDREDFGILRGAAIAAGDDADRQFAAVTGCERSYQVIR